MIEDPHDPRRASRGHHHGIHRPGAGFTATVPDGLLGIRQVAVVVDEAESAEGRMQLACHLAVCLDAGLCGIGITSYEAQPNGLPRPIDRVEQRFRAIAGEYKLASIGWRTVSHGAVDEMVGSAKLADLTVLGHSAGSDDPGGLATDQVVLATGRPCLLVPSSTRFEHVGQDVVVAWDGSREAVRALADALPLLRDAGSVVVLEVGERQGRHRPDQLGADAAVDYLARHGVQAFSTFIDAAGRSVADAIVERLQGSSVDLVVAGLFGRSPTRERLMGGTSRDLLEAIGVPMLVSH